MLGLPHVPRNLLPPVIERCRPRLRVPGEMVIAVTRKLCGDSRDGFQSPLDPLILSTCSLPGQVSYPACPPPPGTFPLPLFPVRFKFG